MTIQIPKTLNNLYLFKIISRIERHFGNFDFEVLPPEVYIKFIINNSMPCFNIRHSNRMFQHGTIPSGAHIPNFFSILDKNSTFPDRASFIHSEPHSFFLSSFSDLFLHHLSPQKSSTFPSKFWNRPNKSSLDGRNILIKIMSCL